MTDKEIVESEIGLTTTNFDSLFGQIRLSEIIKYYSNSPLINEPINGISFYGRDIDLEVYRKLQSILSSRNLKLLASFRTLTKRWNDFKFPDYKSKDQLIDIRKQCFCIIKETNDLRLLNSVYAYETDRTLFNDIIGTWDKKYKIEVLWNDYYDIVLLFNDAYNHKLDVVQDIKRLCHYKLTEDITDNDRIESISENWPIISLSLK